MTAVRYPAYPLIVHDPFFSCWSFTDDLAADATRHWTGALQSLSCVVRIDGKAFRCMNAEPNGVPAARQTSVEVLPTRTVYAFEENGVRIRLSFLSPLLPARMDVLSRPAAYVIFETESLDGAVHSVLFFYGVSGDFADGNNRVSYRSGKERAMTWSRLRKGGMELLCIGRTNQPVLEKCGDDVRIDWGYVCLAVPGNTGAATCLVDFRAAAETFAADGTLPADDCCALHTPFPENGISACCAIPLTAGPGGTASAHVITAYNDFYSIEFLNRKLKGYWTLSFRSFEDMVTGAERDFAALDGECRAFDAELLADASEAGGDGYAALLAAAFRQAVGAHKLVADIDGTPLFFSKENFSNGCIATVDVTYPSAPLFLLMQPEMLKGMMIPILEYASTARWKFPFAPHDLGTYPLANGQVYGGAETSEEWQMPVEECGN